MRARFKVPLLFITILLSVTLLVFLSFKTYLKYRNDSSIEIDIPLSINYLNSFKISRRNSKNIKFSVTNNGEDIEYYYIYFDDIKNNNHKISYELTSDNKTSIKKVLEDNIISSFISIEPNETHYYTLNMLNNVNNFKAKLRVSKEEGEKETFASLILDHNEYKEKSITNVGNEVATMDEGLIKDIDDDGNTYYFRGSANNNFVSFANLVWRIVRINGDGSVKLILENSDLEGKLYSDIEKLNFDISPIYNYLQTWYNENIDTYDEFVSYHKFCNDNTEITENEILSPYKRIVEDKIATFKCLGNNYSSKIGLITIDEVIYAGSSYKKVNNDYYLNDSSINNGYFTMSGAALKKDKYHPFYVKSNGDISDDVDGFLIREIRPVINIIKVINMTGKGTKDNPYKLASN